MVVSEILETNMSLVRPFEEHEFCQVLRVLQGLAHCYLRNRKQRIPPKQWGALWPRSPLQGYIRNGRKGSSKKGGPPSVYLCRVSQESCQIDLLVHTPVALRNLWNDSSFKNSRTWSLLERTFLHFKTPFFLGIYPLKK